MQNTSTQKQIVLFSIILLVATGCEKIEQTFKGEPTPPATATPAVPQPAVASAMPANALARVGTWSITKEEFSERLAALKEVVPEYDTSNPEARRMVLDELVRQQILVIDAEKKGVANNKDIKAAVEEFRRTLIVREVASKLIEGITVTDEEAKQFYEEQKELLRAPEQWRVSEIVVEDQIKANEVLVEALKGTDFAELAKQHSIGDTASDGGDLGFLQEEPFPAMVDALVGLDTGKVSSVFKGPKGYYIVKLVEKKGGEQIPYDEIKEDIVRNRTLVKQQQAILDHIKKLETEIKVEINEDLLK